MTKHVWGCLVGLGLLVGACERDGGIRSEVEDLKEARQETGQVVQDLQQQLQEAKAQVARLEERLTLARQGVTDEVLEERQDLQEAVKNEQADLRQNVNEIQKEAQQQNAAASAAERQLEQTQPAEVETRVNTETQVTRQPSDVDVATERETIEVERVNVSGQDKEGQPQDTSGTQEVQPSERSTIEGTGPNLDEPSGMR